MQIGTARLTFRLHGNRSLKGKRQVTQALTSRLRQRFNLSVAEVGGIDTWQTLVLGLVCVSNNGGHASEMIDNAVAFVRRQRVDADLIDIEREVIDGD